MKFTLHRRSKTGEYYPQTYQIEGPNLRGYMLHINHYEGHYLGPAAIPQTIRGGRGSHEPGISYSYLSESSAGSWYFRIMSTSFDCNWPAACLNGGASY